jgi:peptide deformylase
MRSRYAAYALNVPEYIIQTTHPASPEYAEDREKWRRAISVFSNGSQFEKLEVLDFQENGLVASVTFVAHLTQKKQDATFTEKSYFEKIKGRWFYRVGQLMSGHAPNLMTMGQMRVLPLAYYGNPILRRVADPVVEITDSVRKLVEEMIETMDACDGLGLAAPQVHHSTQIFVIRVPIEDDMGQIQLGDAKVFINAKISEASATTWTASEGCLSIPSIHADVERPKEITVEYTNLDGDRRKERCSGWLARVIMHEHDHIQGVLFIDHLPIEEREALEPFLKRLDKRIHDGTEL